jgi:RNA polymerase sigma-70 factor (ECF subfamily)
MLRRHLSEEAVVDVVHDACVEGFDKCDPRVTFPREEAETLVRQEFRHSNQQGEIINLYVHVRPSLYAYLSTLGLVSTEAEDVIQEGFFRLVRDLSAGSEVRNPRGWLFRVAHNLAMDVYRSADRDGAVCSENLLPILREQVDPKPDPEEAYSQQEKRRYLNSAIQNLTSQQRNGLLYRAEGMSYQDIGVILGVSTQRAAFLVQRSLEHLSGLWE